MPTAKIRVRTRSVEFEYEGDDEFVKSGLMDALSEIMQLGGGRSNEIELDSPNSPIENDISDFRDSEISLSTVAAHLSLEGGQDFVLAAIAKLQLVDGKDKTTRAEILDEMQKATSFYDENARKGLSSNLSRLTKKKKINHLSGSTYALSAGQRAELKAKIAAID